MPAIDNTTLRRLLQRKSEIPAGVESRCVATYDYDLESNELTVVFQARGTYKYRNFPLAEFVDFANSFSLGQYFNLYIRDQYSFERLA